MAEQGPLTGQRLGEKFLLGELLGQGGFGAVYKAQHLLLNRPQAIKVLLEQHFGSPKFRERFIREAQTLAALDHANILPVHDFGVEGSRAYLVMPFISGGTLQGVLKARPGPLSLNETARYLAQICAALDYAHKRGVVHLDLKPLNLLLHEDGRLLLSDFGLAHLMEQGAVEGGTSLQFGSPLYMAPEHFDGKPEQRSDLYALGIILYQLLAGRVPFNGTSPVALMRQHMLEAPPALHTAHPDLPQALDAVLGKALAKQPAQRYQSAGELLYDFQAALAGQMLQLGSLDETTHPSQAPSASTLLAANPPISPAEPTLSDAGAMTPIPNQSSAPQPFPVGFSGPARDSAKNQPGPTVPRREEGTRRMWEKPKGRWAMSIMAGIVIVLLVAGLLITHWPFSSKFAGQAATSSQLTPPASATATSTTLPTATVNPTAAAFFTQPYIAARPGMCDQGGAVWANPKVGILTCTSNALRLDNTGVNSQDKISELERFDGPLDRTFPTQYSVSIHVVGVTSAWCTQLQIDASDVSDLTVCHGQDAPCDVGIQNSTIHHPCQIADKTAYTLAIRYQTDRTIFSIDGVQVDSVPNISGQAPKTVSIEFGNWYLGKGIIDYQDFVFTPLP